MGLIGLPSDPYELKRERAKKIKAKRRAKNKVARKTRRMTRRLDKSQR